MRVLAGAGAAEASSAYAAVELKRSEVKDQLVIASLTAFALSTMDKVNISIAIIPMAQEFGWSAGAAGIVQSSFFFGYLLAQLPGGYFASRLGGRRVLPIGLSTWSLGTFIAPLMASSVSTLGISRSMVGLGQAVAPTSIVDMIARVVPKEQRSSAISMAFSGTHVGAIAGMLAAPVLVDLFGWRSIFYTFGALGLVWYVWFEALMRDVQVSDPEVAAVLTTSVAQQQQQGGSQQQEIPFRAFVRSPAVQALCFTHFGNNWFHYTLLAWMPSYFTDVLQLEDLSGAAHNAVIPPMAGILCSLIAGPLADKMIGAGWQVPTVRKIMQNIALLGPAACLGLCMFLASSGSEHSREAVLPLITVADGLSAFSLAGLYCTHSDMSPKYAGAMLGLTNCSGAIAGSLGVFSTGVILDQTNSWDSALLIPNVILLCLGAASFTFLCRNEATDFDSADNSPFVFEKYLEGPKKAVVAAMDAVHDVAVGLLEKFQPPPPEKTVADFKQQLVVTRSLAMQEARARGLTVSSIGTSSILALVDSNLRNAGGAEAGAEGAATSSGKARDQGVVVTSYTMATLTDFDAYDQLQDAEKTAEDLEISMAEDVVEEIMKKMKLEGQLKEETNDRSGAPS